MKNSILDYKVFAITEISKTHHFFMGDNERQILVAFDETYTEEIWAFLTRIMASVQINLEKDCLILRGGDTINFPSLFQITSLYTVKKAILFGITPKDLHLNIEAPLYMPFRLNDCTFLFADPLSKITTRETKQAVWDCLKHIFN